jgi:hypothetical protein
MIASVERLFTAPMQRDPLGVQRNAASADGGGPDLSQVVALLNDVLVTQRKIRLDLTDLAFELKENIQALHAQLGYRLDGLAAQVALLREELASYHAAVVGHGELINEVHARLQGEQHLDVPPPPQD